MRRLPTPSAMEFGRMTTPEIRKHFLLEDLFAPGKIEMVYTGLDRLIVGGIMPEPELRLPSFPELAAEYFTENREIGIINIGDPGEVRVGNQRFPLGSLDCLYVGAGEPDIMFVSDSGGQAAFYLLSAPAHRKFPTCKAGFAEATVKEMGTAAGSSRRKLVQYIHEHGIQSCQLVMGYTAMEEGSVWNTWPPHTHLRRSEIYFYFDMGERLLVHLLGEPAASRHVTVRDRQAVLSPPWSIHSGVGTGGYSFIWGMAGENRTFADMDHVDLGTFA